MVLVFEERGELKSPGKNLPPLGARTRTNNSFVHLHCSWHKCLLTTHSYKNVDTLSRNFDLFWLTIAASHTTVRHNTYALPPHHSKLFLQLLSMLVLLATFTTGRGGSTNTRSWYRVSIIFELVEALTRLTFLASKTGASNMWKNNIFPSRNVWEPENLFSLLRCLQLFGQPTFAVIGRCCLYWLPKRPHETQLRTLVPFVLWRFVKMAANKRNTLKAAKRMSSSIKGRERL